jgi:hypothetical protein
MKNEKVIADLAENTKALLHDFKTFSPAKFTHKPFPGSWSPAELGEHLLALEYAVNKVLQGKAEATERDPAHKIQVVKDAFADIDKKYPSPENLIPGGKITKQKDLLERLWSQREFQAALISDMDMTLLCTEFKHPRLGGFTRLEWVYFNIQHTDRHLAQLKRMAAMM